ncbi:MAG: hypothetical protein ACE5FY_04105 [Nitrospiria bacterium]
MKALELLILSIDPDRVYLFGEQVAWTVFTYMTPVLLVIAVAVRTLETQLDTTTSMGKWERALRDFFLFGFLIGSYFGIMMMFNVLMNEIYVMTHDLGNFELLAKQIEKMIANENPGNNEKIGTALSNFSFWAGNPFLYITTAFYWVSNFIVVSTHVILKGTHGIIYTFVLVYGLIAIPMSMTSNFKLLKGWATLLGGTMLWPIVEGLLLGFFGVLFQDATREIIHAGNMPTGENNPDFKVFFSVINVTLAFMMILAPVISSYLVSNAHSMLAILTPFASGTLSVGLGTLSASRTAVSGGFGFEAIKSGSEITRLISPSMLSGRCNPLGASGGGPGTGPYSGGPSARAYGACSAGNTSGPNNKGSAADSAERSETALKTKKKREENPNGGHLNNHSLRKTNVDKENLT